MRRAALLSLLLAACGQDDDFPARLDAGLDSGNPAASLDGSFVGRSEPDARADAAGPIDRSWIDVNAGRSCSAQPATCNSRKVDLRGESPLGPVRITELGVSYWSGRTAGTALFARAEAAGQSFVIDASIYTGGLGGSRAPNAPPGSYRSDVVEGDPHHLYVNFVFCESVVSLAQATLDIERHDVPPPSEPLEGGSPVQFNGVLQLSDPGWSLRIPFSIDSACGSSVEL